ncbi:anthrone oxygenase family protein [Streptomyces albogriseolus]|uniref:anthrone oxygenase family protein n=1 Tax=Streptomyces albogriseolus TaxID=1887 RepID=UPI0037AC874E
MLSTLEVTTVVIVGLMVGVEFSVAFVLNRVIDALPEDSAQQAHAHGGRMLGAVMPVWYVGSLVLVAVWAVAGRDGTGLLVTAAALLVLSVIMSLLLLVPINNRNKTWTPENRPADWRQQLDRWARYHYGRLALIAAAFALLAVARG